MGCRSASSEGANAASEFAPPVGYWYDGFYYVEDYWRERGSSEFHVWRFRLRKNPSENRPTPPGEDFALIPPPRRQTTIQRIVRSTATADRVKGMHGYLCQVCRVRLETRGGDYAEGAHIRPLGDPHNGPDAEDNILCLCPNHHVLFDRGGFSIADDLTLIGIDGSLRITAGHTISRDHLAYHREHYGNL